MKSKFLIFNDVTFVYDSASEALFRNISFQAGPGWTGIVGANGTGKTTLLKLATGLLKPNEGHIERTSDSVYCSQRTDYVPDRLNDLIVDDAKSAHILKGSLGVDNDWVRRWLTLSHGERKRAQIAVALWLGPAIFAIDEPTNHIDSEAQEVVANALKSFSGIGLLVSHDRELLDSLCRQCLFTEPPNVILRPGGITKATEVAKMEQQTIQKQYAIRKRAYKRLQREVTKRKELASQSDKRRSKRTLAKKDSDGREKKDRARVRGKDGVGGKLSRQLAGRLRFAHERLENTAFKKQYTLGIWLPGSVSKRNLLLRLPAGSLSLGGHKCLHHPELLIGPKDRIAITGSNGSGKSTLIRCIIKSLNLPKEHVTYVPQEIDLKRSKRILAEAVALPNDKLGHLMTIVSRLGSRPERLLDSVEPSPGETRKLLLAIGMTYAPHIIIMDEPTNHMDLPSIECLEKALSECPCSLVLVSHDKRFLVKLVKKQWNIAEACNSPETFVLKIT